MNEHDELAELKAARIRACNKLHEAVQADNRMRDEIARGVNVLPSDTVAVRDAYLLARQEDGDAELALSARITEMRLERERELAEEA